MKFYAFLAILVAATLAAAPSPPPMPGDWSGGRSLELPDARSVALGGVSVAIGSPFGFLANPALGVLRYDRFNAPHLPENRPRPAVGLAYHLGVVAEQRTRTIYDSYENAIGEMAVGDNTEASGLGGPIAVQFPFSELNLGVGVLPQRDYTYHFHQDVRDDFYHLVGIRDLNLSGQVMRANLSLAGDLFGAVGIGAGVNYLFGERRFEVLDSALCDTLPLHELSCTNPSGLAASLGLLLHPGTALRVGLTLEPRPLALPKFLIRKGDTTTIALSEPLKVKLGANYFAASAVPTGIFGQLSYSDWHTLDTSLTSVLDLRGGVEHRLLNGVCLRYGFGLLPSQVDPAIQTGLVSLGFGFETDLAHIDLGGNLQRRVFGSGFLSPMPPEQMHVYETNWEIGLSIARGF